MKTKSLLITSVVISAIFFGTSAVADKIIYVDHNATGLNNGTSWKDAFNHLQVGILTASDGDEIRVAQGTYKPNEGIVADVPDDRALTFQLKNGVTIKGGYTGCNAPDPDVRDIQGYQTILSGDLAGNDIELADPADLPGEPTRRENTCNVVTATGCDRTAVLNGFTITAGNATGLILAGGAIYDGTPTISYCRIVANYASGCGGGIYFASQGHSPGALLDNCIVAHNAVAGTGGGIYGCAEIVNCTITNNYAIGGSDSGALDLGSSCETTITDTIFSYNKAGTVAGAVFIDASNSIVTFTRCSFIGNSAGDRGGAIYIDGCTCGSDVTFQQCRFIANSAGGNGGAIFDYGFTDTKLFNCLLIGNHAGLNGGAMCDGYDGGSSLVNCTVSANTADLQGGGICYTSGSYKGRTLYNTIIWANSDSNGQTHEYSQIYTTDTGVPASIEYCCIQALSGTLTGHGNIHADPRFADPNPTTAAGYHLKSQAGHWDPESQRWVIDDVTSPCIDAGDPMSPIGNEPFPNGGRINMGAYGGTAETSKSYLGGPICETIIAGDINGDCKVDFTDFAIMARHWLRERTEIEQND